MRRSIPGLCLLISILGCGQPSPSPAGHDSTTSPTVTPDKPSPAPSAEAAATPTTAPSAVETGAPAPSAIASAAPTARPALNAAPAATTAAPAPSVAPTATAIAAAPTAAPSATATADVKPPVEVMSPKVVEGSFNVWMQSAGRYAAGQQGAVQVVLVAKGDWHCNEKYPYKFKLGSPSGGVSYPVPVVRAEAIKVTPDRSIMTVPFVPSASGDARVSGTFSFSVCSAASCQIETRDLALTVKVD